MRVLPGRLLAGAVAIATALSSPLPAMQAAASDTEVVKGIAEVDSGDYDAAILRLDAAARRLAGRADKRADFIQASIYLGVAYLGTGHETSTRGRFRDALALDGTLRLSPAQFSPRVIEQFEKAREEVPAAAATAATARRGGGGKTALIIGAGAAAAGGAALALGGGGGGGNGTPATTTPSAFGTLLQQPFSGLIPGRNQFFDVTVRANGMLRVTLDWTSGANDLDVYLATPACTNTSDYPPDVCSVGARAEPPTAKPEVLQAPVTAGAYRIVVSWCGDPACGTGSESGTVQAVLQAP